MKIVVLERNSVGPDISIDIFNELGEVTAYRNTVSVEEVIERTREADIVVANLFAEIIVRLIPAIRTHLKKDGVFISTGILKERIGLVEDCLQQHGFAVRQIRETDEWCAVEAVVM